MKISNMNELTLSSARENYKKKKMLKPPTQVKITCENTYCSPLDGQSNEGALNNNQKLIFVTTSHRKVL